MNKSKTLKSKKTGSAIVLAVLAIVILFVLGLGLMALGLQSRIFVIRTASQIRARCAADAGLARAVFEMSEKLKVKPWSDTSLPVATDQTLPGSDAVFSYTVTGNTSTGYAVESTGTSGYAEKKVYCNLVIKLTTFEYPFFADGLEIMNSATIDGYDSYSGLYGGSNQGLTSLGTNSTESGAITLELREIWLLAPVVIRMR